MLFCSSGAKESAVIGIRSAPLKQNLCFPEMFRAGEMGMTSERHLIRDHHHLYDVSWEVLPRVHPMEAVVHRGPRLHGKLIAGHEKNCIELSQMVLILKNAGVPEKD